MGKYEIKAPVNFTGKGWGLAFVEGVAATDDPALAGKLERKGYTVTTTGGETPAGNPPTEEGTMYACPVCGKEYKTQKYMEDHMAKKHPEAGNAPEGAQE